MMKYVGRWALALWMVCLAVAVSGCSTTSYVNRGDGGYGNRVARKFSRGVVNVASAPLEIPIRSIESAEEGEGPMETLSGYIGGFLVGTGYCLWRLGAGAVDLVTAPAVFWDKALVRPEFIDLGTEGEPSALEVDAEQGIEETDDHAADDHADAQNE